MVGGLVLLLYIPELIASSNFEQALDNKLDGIIERLDQLEFVVKKLSIDNSDCIEKNTEKTNEFHTEFKLPSILKIIANMFQLPIKERTIGILEDVSDKVKSLEATLEETKSQLGSLEATVNSRSSRIEEKVETSAILSKESVQLATVIKTRQEAWLSEVRLVSLFKLTDENNPRTSGSTGDYNPGLLVDGQFELNSKEGENKRTWSHTESAQEGNSIWIKLGGKFRVYSIRLWNRRDGDVKGRIDGTDVYVDDAQVGTAEGCWGFYDFTLPENEAVYGSTVTLIQPNYQYLHLLEVQVWGNGPYDNTDVFN